MNIDAWSYEVWTRTVWMEARGESPLGRSMVAYSIYNRFVSGKWYSATTIAGVCMKDQQYSCWNAARDDNNREAMNALAEDDPVLAECRGEVDGVLEGEEDPTGGATHYHDVRLPQTPSWALDPQAVFIVQEGHHKFYKGVK